MKCIEQRTAKYIESQAQSLTNIIIFFSSIQERVMCPWHILLLVRTQVLIVLIIYSYSSENDSLNQFKGKTVILFNLILPASSEPYGILRSIQLKLGFLCYCFENSGWKFSCKQKHVPHHHNIHIQSSFLCLNSCATRTENI